MIDDSEESSFSLKIFLIEKYYSKQPEIIFLDLVIPKLDGLSVFKKIRSQDHSSKIIILIGNDDPEIFNECTELGVLSFLIKPFNLNDVSDIILFSNEITLMK